MGLEKIDTHVKMSEASLVSKAAQNQYQADQRPQCGTQNSETVGESVSGFRYASSFWKGPHELGE